MHMVIYALVEESTHDDALATGKTVFDRLVGADPHAGAVFDYHVTFDEEDTSVAGTARWGELPTAAPVDSDDGQELLERGWEATKEEFERNLDRVKEAIGELSDEEIMRDEGPRAARLPPGRCVRRPDDLPVHRTRNRHSPPWTAGPTPRGE